MSFIEIERRLAQIKKDMNTEGADIDALTKETDDLIAKRSKIKEDVEKRSKLISKIGEGQMGEGTPVVKEKPEERSFDVSSPEYRSAYLKKLRKIDLTDIEKRAFSSASTSAGAAIPTQTANEILKKVENNASLLNEVTLLHVAGNVKFAVEGTKADAAKHTENGSLTATTDTLTEVSLTAYEINKLVQVSKSVATMSIDAFESWLTGIIAEKMADKINAYLISGTGTSEPQGLESAATWGDTNSITVTKTGSLTAANVQALIGMLPSQYDANGKFVMSKKTLFTDFMPLQDNSKNGIVTVEGKNYYVYGYPVLINSNIALHDAYLGDPKKIIANLSENINIVSAFDIDSNSYKYLGSAMFDSKVALDDSFVKLTKATA